MDIVWIDVYGDPYTVVMEGDKVIQIAAGKLAGVESEYPLAQQVKEEFKEYFEGKRQLFTFPIDFQGTSFEKKVYEGMLMIPYGCVMSYGELAEMIGHQGAARAVGTACGKNRIPFVIPCHRVVGKQSIGGFGLGIDLKIKLLGLEKRNA